MRRQNLRWFVIRSKRWQLFQRRPVAEGHLGLYYRITFPNSSAHATLISSEEMMRSLQQVVAWQLYTTLDSHHTYKRMKWLNVIYCIKLIVIQMSENEKSSRTTKRNRGKTWTSLESQFLMQTLRYHRNWMHSFQCFPIHYEIEWK